MFWKKQTTWLYVQLGKKQTTVLCVFNEKASRRLCCVFNGKGRRNWSVFNEKKQTALSGKLWYDKIAYLSLGNLWNVTPSGHGTVPASSESPCSASCWEHSIQLPVFGVSFQSSQLHSLSPTFCRNATSPVWVSDWLTSSVIGSFSSLVCGKRICGGKKLLYVGANQIAARSLSLSLSCSWRRAVRFWYTCQLELFEVAVLKVIGRYVRKQSILSAYEYILLPAFRKVTRKYFERDLVTGCSSVVNSCPIKHANVSTDWLTDWLVNWLIDWLIDWVGWSIDWLVDGQIAGEFLQVWFIRCCSTSAWYFNKYTINYLHMYIYMKK